MRPAIVEAIETEVRGIRPLQPLVDDPEVSDILVEIAELIAALADRIRSSARHETGSLRV